jgi:POT family proton-dependent oligopeptide transporter
MWERFSFYGMRAILTLFLAASLADGGLGMADAVAVALYSTYNSMVYFMSLPGGWLADRVLGTRKAVLFGGIIIATGHYLLAVHNNITFYLGLCAIVIGTGLLKPNISAMVGELYDKHGEMAESKRDSGFTIFYMAINIGALLAPLLTGYFAEKKQFHIGFGIAAVGMTVAVIQYVLGGKRLEGVGLKAHHPLLSHERKRILTIAGIVAAALLVIYGIDVAMGTFNSAHVRVPLTLLALGVPVAYFAMMFRDRELRKEERSRVQAYVWIFLGATLFWMIYDQSGSVVNLFTDTKVDRDLGFFTIPTAWFQSVNSFFILLLAPLFAWLWVKLGPRQPGTPVKFSWAIIGIGLSFIVMAIAGSFAAKGLISAWWIIGVYLIQTIAELMLSPVGLSVTTKLAPMRYASQVMGLWFLATSAGNAISAWVGPLSEKFRDVVYYGTIGTLAIIMGLCFWLGSRAISRLMAGVH